MIILAILMVLILGIFLFRPISAPSSIAKPISTPAPDVALLKYNETNETNLKNLFLSEQELSVLVRPVLTASPLDIKAGQITPMLSVRVPLSMENEVVEIMRNYSITDNKGEIHLLRETIVLAKTDRARENLEELVKKLGGRKFESLQEEINADRYSVHTVNSEYFMQFIKKDVFVQVECSSQNFASAEICFQVLLLEAKRISSNL